MSHQDLTTGAAAAASEERLAMNGSDMQTRGRGNRKLMSLLTMALVPLFLGSAFSTTAAPMAVSKPAAISAEIHAKPGSSGLRLEHHSKSLAAVTLFPGQGIVLVAGGAVHDDADSDGLLDAGEGIDYTYTVINLGDSPLSGLAVADSLGAVSCPQATLAVGQHMVCTRAYVLTPADATAGAVINGVEVQGQDGGGRPVQASDVLIVQNLAGGAGIRVFKSPQVIADSDATGTVTLGDVLRYTFVVKNSGEEALSAVNLTEPDPDRIDTGIVCNATTLGGQAFSGNATGSLASGDTILCRADYEVRQSDADLGQVLNLVEVRASAPVAGPLFASGASAVTAAETPMPVIGVAKSIEPISGTGPYSVSFRIVVRNYGIVPLSDVQVVENLRDTFPLPVSFSVLGMVVNGTAVANPDFDGEGDINMLVSALSTLAVDDEIIIDLDLEVDPGAATGPYFNTVTASGRDTNGVVVADVSVSGTNPDPDGDGIPDENTPTPIQFPPRAPVLNQPAVIPSSSTWSLLLLMLAMAAAGMVGVVQRR